MIQTTLLSLFLLAGFSSTPALKVTFSDAIQQQLISVEASSPGGLPEKPLSLKIANDSRRDLELLIPAGYIFPSQDSSEQDLITIQDRQLAIAKKSSRIVKLPAMCIQASHAAPGKGSGYRPGGPASGKLGKLVSFVNQKNILESDTQYALWAVTDGEDLANIVNEELRKFTADLLGLKAPSYSLIHESMAPQAGQRAFVPNPVVVRGTFEYQTEVDILASFGLFDENGKEVVPFFTDQEQRRGGHRFRFTFEIRHLPPGTYYARLRDGERTIGEQQIEW